MPASRPICSSSRQFVSRISSSLTDCIQISERTYELIKDDFITSPRGIVKIKGKGEMPTWFLVGRK